MVHYLCMHENHGYLSGALWLALFIFLYQLTTNIVERRVRGNWRSNPCKPGKPDVSKLFVAHSTTHLVSGTEQAEWRRKMDNTTDLPGKQTSDGTTVAGGVKQQDAVQTRRRVVIPLWVLGFMLLAAASVIVRLHPAPWPFDLQTTFTLQDLQLPSWLSAPIVWASIVDNPIPTAITFVVWLVVLSLIGVGVWRRGGLPMPWFVTAIFISIGTVAMDGLDQLIGFLVSRPRPSSPPIHIYMPETVPSFPSGHVENDVVYYGFLLYLSLTKPVSEWRYRWILIPFQLYAVLNILLIGFSRVYEGSHWLTDVLGGYLSGALCLTLLIFLYRWTLDKLNKWYAKRLLEKSMQTQ